MNYAMFPEKAGWGITTYFLDADYKKQFGEDHYGIDMAYQSKHYDGIRYIYAIADGVVSGVQHSNGTTANAIQIKHYDLIEGKTVITRFYHLASIADGIKKGKEVKKGDIIGVEGKTGNATGSHLHFEFWVCPNGYKFNYKEIAKYAVDPLEYLYLHDGQVCVYDPKEKVKKVPVFNETPLPDISVFECLRSNALNYRTSPEINKNNLVGLLPEGEYQAISTCENENFTWVKFKFEENNYWATVYDDLSLLLIGKSLEEQIAALAEQNILLLEENKQLKEDIIAVKKILNKY